MQAEEEEEARVRLERAVHAAVDEVGAESRGQLAVRVTALRTLGGGGERRLVYVDAQRVHAVPPVDAPPPAQTVGAWGERCVHSHWSHAALTDDASRGVTINEEFYVTVDHAVRDGVRLRVVESLYFGAQTRVLAERTLYAGSLLPAAQKQALRSDIEQQHRKLAKLLDDYRVVYKANAIELQRIQRDIDALEHELAILARAVDPLDPSTGIECELKFISTDLSPPTDMQHSLHIGLGASQQFETANLPEAWAEIFRKAGVLRQELSDADTFKTLLSTIGDRLTPLEGGVSGGENNLRASRIYGSAAQTKGGDDNEDDDDEDADDKNDKKGRQLPTAKK